MPKRRKKDKDTPNAAFLAEAGLRLSVALAEAGIVIKNGTRKVRGASIISHLLATTEWKVRFEAVQWRWINREAHEKPVCPE